MDQPIVTKSDIDQRDLRAARWSLIGCSALVFITSVCIMVLELTASRLIAKAVGSSLYTWTSVIGVILAGISIGNFLGGWLADRYDHRRTLAWLFFISSFCCITIYPLSQMMSTRGRPGWISWQLWVVVIVSSLFLHPSIALGMISPITASMALAKARHTGSTVGNVYAWGAMGSIFGTFLAGFYLISMFGTQHIIWMTAATLALLGVIVASGQRMFRGAMLFGWLQLVFWVGMLASVRQPEVSADDRVWFNDLLSQTHKLGLKLNLRSDDPDEYNAESDYFYINIANRHEEGDTVKALHLDHLTHSYYNTHKPTRLYYDYEKVYAAVTERAAEMWDRQTSVKLSTLPDETWRLPSWAKFDPTSQQLSVRGAINSKKREALLAASPSGAYWKAIEDLTSPENMAVMSGLSSVPLEKLPPNTVIPETLGKKLRHDETLGALIRYSTCTPAEREQFLKLAPHQEYRQAVDELFERSRQVSTMFVGGGGFVFPRWIEAYFPRNPLIHVLELDPAVKLAVQREMGLPEDGFTFVKTLLGDARNSVDDLLNGMAYEPPTPGKHHHYDFIYGDAFNDFSVPWHLTTKEFDEKIKALLTPNEGVFLVNVIDIYPRAEAPVQTTRGAGQVSRVRGAFPPEIWPSGRKLQQWYPVADSARLGKVELREMENGQFELRCHSTLTNAQFNAWKVMLDTPLAVAIADEKGAAPEKVAAATKSTVDTLEPLEAISELYDQSNETPVYTGELPAVMMPERLTKDRWVLARAPYDFLEIRQRDTPAGKKLPTPKSQSYLLGLRGVMSASREEELVKLAGANTELQAIFRELSRQSRAFKPGRFLGAYVNTVCQVFPNVYVFSANEGLPSAVRDTFVVACSLKKLNFVDLKRNGDYWSTPQFAAMETGADNVKVYSSQMASILEMARGMTLTDDYAPVDNLLIPVFADQ